MIVITIIFGLIGWASFLWSRNERRKQAGPRDHGMTQGRKAV